MYFMVCCISVCVWGCVCVSLVLMNWKVCCAVHSQSFSAFLPLEAAMTHTLTLLLSLFLSLPHTHICPYTLMDTHKPSIKCVKDP